MPHGEPGFNSPQEKLKSKSLLLTGPREVHHKPQGATRRGQSRV